MNFQKAIAESVESHTITLQSMQGADEDFNTLELGRFTVDEHWNGFSKLISQNNGDVMIVYGLKNDNSFGEWLDGMFSTDTTQTKEVKIITATPDLSAKIKAFWESTKQEKNHD